MAKTADEIKKEIEDRNKKDEERIAKALEREKKKAERAEIEKERAERKLQRESEAAARRDAVRDSIGDAADLIEYASDGSPKKTPANLRVVVEEDMRMHERLRKNVFTGEYELDGRPFSDEMMRGVAWKVSDVLNWYDPRTVGDMLSDIAASNAYHPILEAVDAIEWDGTPRLETFFINAIGADDCPSAREVSFKWLCAMYRRVARPGCWFDAYIILQDAQQGTGKSRVFEKLVTGLGITDADGDEVNYSIVDAKPDLTDKDNSMKINSCAICAFDEGDGTKFANLESFKSFITQSDFSMRLPYDRHVRKFKVHCVYALTTNHERFLTDTTSDYERRAWVMRCHGVKRDDDEWWEPRTGDAVIRQVWAEAKHWNEHPDEARARFGWNIEGNAISFLTPDNTEAMKGLQAGAKTWEDDDAVINAMETILTRKYARVVWENSADFIREVTGWTTTISGDSGGCVDVIPVKWFYEAVNKLCGAKRTRSSQYLSSVMASPTMVETVGKWVKKERMWYKGTGRQTTCYVREGSDSAPKERQRRKTVPLSSAAKHAAMPEFGTDMTDISPNFVTSKK